MSASGMAEVGALVHPVEGDGDRADAGHSGQWSIEGVAIEEIHEPARTRRASDLVRLVLDIVAVGGLLIVGSLRLGTASGLQDDLTDAATNAPELIVRIIAATSGVVILALPVYLVGELAWQRRWRLLAESTMAALIAFGITEVFRRWVAEGAPEALVASLSLPVNDAVRTSAAFPLFAGIVSFVSVSGLGGRIRTAALVWLILTGLGLLLVIDGRATPLALLVSVLAGHTVGVATRVALGSENPRAPVRLIVEALARVGVQPVRVRQAAESELGRCYEVDTTDRRRLALQVFDPDRRTTTLLRTIVRSVRLRSWVSRSTSYSQRRAVEQAALPVLAATQAQVRAPALVAAAEVDATTTLYAEDDSADLRSLRSLPAAELTDELLTDAWTQVQQLHRVGVAHEALDPDALAVDAAGRIWLRNLSQGEIAASPLRLRLDDAELLTSCALLVGPERATRAGQLAAQS